MIELLSKLVALVAQFGGAVAAFFWARDRAEAKRLKRQLEVQNAINDALLRGPRDQSDAARRLRDGDF